MFERRQAAAVAGDSQGCILGVVLCELLCDSRNQLEEVLELPSTDDGASLSGYWSHNVLPLPFAQRWIYCRRRPAGAVGEAQQPWLRPQRPCLSCHSSTPNPNRPFRLVGRTYHPVVSAVPPRVDGDACLVVELPATTKHELCFASTMPVGLRRMILLHDRPCDKTNTEVSGTADPRPVRPKCAGG